ncbi:MAG: 1-deoxy-D-xylulose-5-phosphate reductoisomerase [Bacteroidales bacterium]|nr:1-deoxy-D-xylulose-5-phosphate reductoisomerase [Bacteroidales bacterium]
MRKKIAILGSTGSIGRQALDVVRNHSTDFLVECITAQSNYKLLIEQAIEFKPNAVVIADDRFYEKVRNALDRLDIKVFAGDESVLQVLEMGSIDLVLIAIVGFAGLKPTLKAIECGKQIALANKETLVVAGEIVMEKAKINGVDILPVDSEHSAIFQCLVGETWNPIEKIYLTASGGPFRGWDVNQLKRVTPKEALAHPTWEMGKKITIDSATLMNKGLEVIEAKWLFDLDPEQIEVIIHPQSIIHSIVQFEDGSMKAQMGIPDMKLPIQYAFSYPFRIKSDYSRFQFENFPALTFEEPDLKKFRNLAFAFDALKKGGNIPCILNAANEVVVNAFLENKIGFFDMSDIIWDCMQIIPFILKPGLDDFFKTDFLTRERAVNLLNK